MEKPSQIITLMCFPSKLIWLADNFLETLHSGILFVYCEIIPEKLTAYFMLFFV